MHGRTLSSTLHCVRTQQYTREELKALFDLADTMRIGGQCKAMSGKILISLFYEESTRTRHSFESAALRLGGNVISTANAKLFSSAAKGESLDDTIRVECAYGDVIVLRHTEEDAADRAADIVERCGLNTHIINGGCGPNKDKPERMYLAQHPSQALIDSYTIQHELGAIDGITIVFVGDLKYGRTVRSLAYLLGKYKGIKVVFVSPIEFRVNDDIKEYLERHNVSYREVGKLTEALLKTADIVYMTRIQKERLLYSGMGTVRLMLDCTLTQKLAEVLPPHAKILHPLPRNDELPDNVDSLPQAAYFRQAENGVYVRMALLTQMFA